MYEYNLVTNNTEITITTDDSLEEIIKSLDAEFVIFVDSHGRQFALKAEEIIMIEEIKNER